MESIGKSPKIYFISGKARHGKTTTANLIKDEYERIGKRVAITSYAKYIKEYARSFFGWDGREETKPRELLQHLGTEIIRQKLNMPHFFVDRMIQDIKIMAYFFDVIIIDDARFEIEIEIPKSVFSNVTSIKLVRENFDNGLDEDEENHLTEISLDNYSKFDYVIKNNGLVKDLLKQITPIINKEEEQHEKYE
ncbi:MAG: hypothetical protein WC343_03940 [Bacilli bacterium]|jgi:hypothetical protein